jgi:hypothetical protein
VRLFRAQPYGLETSLSRAKGAEKGVPHGGMPQTSLANFRCKLPL